MEIECPRCLYRHFPFQEKDKVEKTAPKDLVYVHECTSGYIRPYPQFMCTTCGPLNDDTELKTLSEIEEINKQRKLLRYREKTEDQIIEAGLCQFA